MGEQAVLVLEDGSFFVGEPFGARVDAEGEVVFNTSMTGYQEICTDPSYRGQMVLLTHPQVGNYGVFGLASESTVPWIAALLVRDLAPFHHHWRAEESLDSYLSRHGVAGLQGIDTRAIVRRLRTRGTMRAVLRQTAYDGLADVRLAIAWEEARNVTPLSQRPVVAEVSGAGLAAVDGDLGQPSRSAAGQGPHIALLDCGVKHNIIRSLERRGARVSVLPWNATLDDILALGPDGVLVSNGPGDPASIHQTVRTVRGLLDRRVPLMGICLGHQALGLAIGATTSRLKYGHHGGNHPVKDLLTGKVYITTQNHEFQVDRDSIPSDSGFFASHVSLNDGSLEGLTHPELPAFSVQFHPEGCPGPQDNQYLFDRFISLVRLARNGRRDGARP